MHKYRVLNGNHLKLIAAVSMLLDHSGLLLFPDLILLRILGRLAYPVFAYMIAEGCFYTRNKLRYFLTIFGMGTACQLVYYFLSGDFYLNILLTFSVSILLIFCLQNLQRGWQEKRIWMLSVFLAALGALWMMNRYLAFDYGFWGAVTPVMVSFFQRKTRPVLSVLMLGVGLVLLGLTYGGIQWFALFSLPLLMMYSGARGKYNMKYFFYIFYPVHLAVLQGISWLLG